MNNNLQPTLSPALFLGFAAKPIPVTILQRIINKFVDKLVADNPEFITRLSCIDSPSWCIVPTDLPFVFYISIAEVDETEKLNVDVYKKDELYPTAKATIYASIVHLIQMMSGQTDGDAMFFGRDLHIEGSTEAVVALRNAMDGSGIDIEEKIVEYSGIFAPVANFSLNFSKSIWQSSQRILDDIQHATLGDIAEQMKKQSEKIAAQNQEIHNLKQSLVKAGIRQQNSRRISR